MATQTLGLQNLTYDCLREILTYLDLPEIKNLRLANRALGDSCTGDRFLACVRRQTTNLSESSLRSLYDLSLNRDLGPAVRELKIRVPIYDPSDLKQRISKLSHQKERQDGVNRKLEWLQGQQKNQEELPDSFILRHLVSCFASLPQLETVSLDFEFVRGSRSGRKKSPGKPRPYSGNLLPRASQLYRLLFSAIVESGISLTSLEIYTGSTQCGVSLSDLAIETWHREAGGWILIKNSIKKFGIRISTAVNRPVTGTERRVGRAQGPWANLPMSEKELWGLLDLLSCLSNIQIFNLSFYSTNKEKRVSKSKIFEAVVRHAHLPLLHCCAFGGLYSNELHLLHLLERHPHIQDLAMDKISLTSGSWRAILGHMRENMPALKRLRLSLLSSDHGWENLDPIWEAPKKRLVHSREFDERDIAKGFDFHPNFGNGTGKATLRDLLDRGPMYGHD